MKPLVFRQQAVTDLNAIWNYTYSKWSEIQADKYYFQIKRAAMKFQNVPSWVSPMKKFLRDFGG
jgi:toxin ParE1/3/4